MQCRDMLSLLPVRQELSWTQQRELESHLRGCPACAAAAARVERTHRALQALPQPSAGPPAHVTAAIRSRLAVAAPPSGYPRRTLAGVALAIVLLLGGLLGRDVIIDRVRALGVAAPQLELYLTRASGAPVRIDPQTLADVPEAAPLELVLPEGYEPQGFQLTADQTTITAFGRKERSGLLTVFSLDARTRAIRSQFELPEEPSGMQLSGDGGRIATLRCDQPRMYATCDSWRVFDLREGRQLGAIPHEQPFVRVWLDATGARLYTLRFSCLERCAGPGTPTLLSYDATTGALIGQVALTDVSAGFWDPAQEGFAIVSPGVALSPDGTRIAILHADRPALTLVDTASMTVLWTKPLADPVGWYGRVPGGAAVDENTSGGFEIHMYFAPNGRQLYAFGSRHGGADVPPGSERGLGMRVIDVERAEIVADAFLGQFASVEASLEGEALYVSARPEMNSTSRTLYRLDPGTLDATAQRPNLQQNQRLVTTLALPPSAQ